MSASSAALQRNVGDKQGMGKEDLFSEVFNRYDKSKIDIDRKEENESIQRYQDTGDM